MGKYTVGNIDEGDLQKLIIDKEKKGELFEESFIWRTTIQIL